MNAEELDRAAAAVQALVATDPALLAGDEGLVALNSLRSVLEAVSCRAAASFEASGAYATDGARTSSAWLTTSCRLPVSVARRQLRRGRAMRELPLAAAAFLAGEITSDHLSLLAGLLKGRTAAAVSPATTESTNSARPTPRRGRTGSTTGDPAGALVP